MAINKNKVQLQETVLDSNGHPLASTDVNPLTSSDCVIMENGMTLEDVMGNDTVVDTPIIMNEDTSFKVGIGDSETKVIDSDVAKMVFEGKTYQNILPKPTTLIMNTDEKEFKINDKIDSSIVLDDNVAEIATIKGQTYVNVVQEESASEYVAIDEELNGQSITTTGKPEGYVKNTTLEGLTLVNVIQEPSETEVTVLDLDADIDAQYATIDNTVQGGIKSAILSGQTLVNLSPFKSLMDVTPSVLNENSVIWYGSVSKEYFNYSIFKPNTKYIVKFGLGTPSRFKGTYISGLNMSNKNGYYTEHNDVFTTPQTIPTEGNLYLKGIDGDVITKEEYSKIEVMILEYQEGMENWDIPYFEGMQSVKMPVLTTTGKNLFKANNYGETSGLTFTVSSNNYLVNGTCTKDDADFYLLTPTRNVDIYQKLNSLPIGTKISVSKNNNVGRQIYLSITQKDGSATKYRQEHTTTENDKTIQCFARFMNGDTFDNAEMNVQVEINSEPTSYEPYKSNILSTPEDLELRGIGNVKDTLDLTTGELTQRIGEIVLDGSENWQKLNQGRYYVNNILNNVNRPGINIVNFKCDKLKTISYAEEYSGTLGIALYAAANYDFIVRTDIQTTEEFKQWLSNNPTTVQYPLATESIKTVDLSVVDQNNNKIDKIHVFDGTTHINASSDELIPNIVIPSQLKYPTIIKPSTTYTVQLKQTTVNSEFPLTINLGGTVMAVPSTKFTITTPETLTSQDAIFTGKNNVIGEVVITEGDTTDIEYRYFEGMNDVKSPKLLARGKNLFDIAKHNLSKDADGDYIYTNYYQSGTPVRYNLKPNTKYTVSYTKTANFDFAMSLNGTWINTNHSTASFTTDNSGEYYIKIGSSAYNSRVNKIWKNIQIEEGSVATSYEPYKGVTIEQSIDSIPLTSDMFEQGRLNDTNFIKGMSLQQLAKEDSTIRIRSSKLIPVKPNAKYIINVPSDSLLGTGMACSFDKNGAYNGKLSSFTSFTTKSDTYFIAGMFGNTDSSTITPSSLDSLNLTLQEVPQEIVLRSLPNGIKDTLNLTTGEYVQRIGEVVLDGSETWSYVDFNNTFRTSIVADKVVQQNDMTLIYVISDKYTSKSYAASWNEGKFISLHTNKQIVFRDENFPTLVAFKQWLSENPVTVQYELATPIIHKVNLTNTAKLPSYNSITHYDTIVPSNSLIPNIKIPSTIDYNVAIKPSTQYTIRANTTSAMSVNLGGSTGTLANGKVTLTTPSTLAHNSLKLGNGKAKEVMVIEGSEIKDNVPFFNGMKNVQMGGIKLVNIARGATCNTLVTANANKTQFTYTANGSGTWGDIRFDKTLLKTKTVYTVCVEIISNTSDNSMKVQLGHGDFGILNIPAGYIGRINKTILSPSAMPNDFGFFFRNGSTSGQRVVIQNPMIIEGDWTHLDEIPFIESEMIIEQPIIRSTSEDGVEPFKQHTLSSNRVIGYEEGCYYGYANGNRISESNQCAMLADVEGLSIAYVTDGGSNYSFWDKDMVFISGKGHLDTALGANSKNGFITVPSNAKYMRFAAGGETNAQPLYKTATVTGELPLRSLPNGVCDSLNLVTGEYVQRVGEVVLDGSSDEAWIDTSKTANNNSRFGILNFTKNCDNNISFGGVLCNYYPIISAQSTYREMHGVSIDDRGSLFIYDKIYSIKTLNDYKTYLSQNPITVQYELATPIVCKIGLTAKGNYKEVELNGRDIWTNGDYGINNIKCVRYYVPGSNISTICPNVIENSPIIVDGVKERVYNTDAHGDYEYISFIGQALYYQIHKDKLQQNTVTEFRKWLSQNPLKIGYLSTNSSSSYSNIQKPIFFNNVKVQFMNDNVDIQPTLTLQSTSRNSYVMDMMKANTKYTLKALINSGSFTIDGTSYGVGTNGTFTSPSTLTNKLLITGQDAQELMIIEGDVTDKTIPYFKGIKSVFEGEDKIEVLSTGKNLFNAYKHKFDTSSAQGLRVEVLNNNSIRTYCTDTIAWRAAFVVYQLEPHTWYNIRCEVTGNGSKQLDISIPEYDTSWNPNTVNCTQSNNMLGKFLTGKSGKVKLTFQGSGKQSISYDNTYTNIQIEKIQEESTVHSFYEPYKSNVTKIPLLSPLRSLPNGVYDELIIDRMKKKATLIQRVGVGVLDGTQSINTRSSNVDTNLYQPFYCGDVFGNMAIAPRDVVTIRCDKLLACSGSTIYTSLTTNAMYQYPDVSARLAGQITKRDLGVKSVGQWFEANPTTVYYLLATPIITEIDLEGYPYIYKDGHIFLNTDIAPVTKTSYNVNQHQLINSQNETIIRHDKQISDLYDYIEIYLDEIYRMELFKMQLELSL